MDLRIDKKLINLGSHQLRGKIITYQFEDSKEERRDKKGGKLKSEKIHEPAEEQPSHNHDEEEEERVFDLAFSVLSSEEGEHDADKDRIHYHREEMAFPDHFFLPEAVSKASSATR